MRTSTLLAAAAAASFTSAQTPAAIVTIEASHGGAGQGLTNTTVTIPLITAYTNKSALAEVSTLYLTDAVDSQLSGISCQPFKNADGSGNAGKAFTEGQPSYLSTNTVVVGSIVCISNDVSFAPPGGPPGGPGSLSSSSMKSHGHHSKTMSESSTQTSTLVKTTHISGGSQHTSSPSSSSASATSSPTKSSDGGDAAQQTGSAARYLSLQGEFFGGLALAGFGLAFAL